MQSFHWQDHGDEILHRVNDLYGGSEIFDCVIQCGDGEIRGHKLILAASSPYFRNIFKSNGGNSLIQLKELKCSGMQKIFDFLYHGYVEVPSSEVSSFMRAATLLQITPLEKYSSNFSGIFSSDVCDDGKSEMSPEDNYAQQQDLCFETASFPLGCVGEVCVSAVESDSYPDMEDVEACSDAMDLQPGVNYKDLLSVCCEVKLDELQEQNLQHFGQGLDVSPPCTESTLGKCDEEFRSSSDSQNADIPPKEASRKKNGDHKKSSRKPVSKSSEKTYLCHVCGQTTKSNCELNYHLLSHTGEKPHACEDCGAAFKKVYSLKVHCRKHTGEKPFLCSRCPAAFRRQPSLRDHMRTHTGEKPYVCTYCESAFALKSNLYVHRRIHTGEKPYVCELCDAAFAHAYSLKVHVQNHLGDKPFLCNHCGKAFKRRQRLNDHIRSHTGENPHVCSFCGKAYEEKRGLEEHVRSHTGETPFVCSSCGRGFSRKRNLIVHMRIHSRK